MLVGCWSVKDESKILFSRILLAMVTGKPVRSPGEKPVLKICLFSLLFDSHEQTN